MTCSSKIFKYPLAVLAETPASYILVYCNASSTAFTAVHCFQFKKKVLELNATWIKAQIELSSTFVYDYKMSTGSSSARNSQVARGGGGGRGGGWANKNETHACEQIFLLQSKM